MSALKAFLAIPAILALVLFMGLAWLGGGLHREVLAAVPTLASKVASLDVAATKARTKAQADCPESVEPSSICRASREQSATAAAALAAARSEALGLKVALASRMTVLAVMVAVQLAIVVSVALGVAIYVAGRPNPKAPFYRLRRSGLAVIGIVTVVACLAALAGFDTWPYPATAAVVERIAQEGLSGTGFSGLSTLASVGFSLFLAALAAVTLAAALLAATAVPDTKLAAPIEDDLEKATLARRRALLTGLLALASACFLVTMDLAKRIGELPALMLPAGDTTKAAREMLAALADSTALFWGIGLSLLLAAIFVPPAAYLLDREAEKDGPPGTSTKTVFDILGDSLVKKILTLLLVVAPAVFPLFAKIAG
ncbi:MAG: hypothetical protein M9939_21650 [Mesorhizobium sp.]|nr:hypothetical protein [Mesorhizobium sp.]MCO5163740.1 hypothetical protein [Mesorhizobium sp.]